MDKKDYKNVFVFAEQREGVIQSVALELLGKARDLADALGEMLSRRGEEVTSVVSLMIPDEMIKERIRHRANIEGRADDAKEETILNRIATYHEKTEPLIEYYRKLDKYGEIDGIGTIEEVQKKVFDYMDKF